MHKIVLFALFAGIFSWLPLEMFGQHLHVHGHPVLQSVEEAERQGLISTEHSLLQRVYAGFAPERLDSRFAGSETIPVRCMTPVLHDFEQKRHRLPPATVQEIEELITPRISGDTQSYLSESGNFIIYYDLEGTHAVPLDDESGSDTPDYVELAAFAADSSYRHQVETLGFEEFLRDEPYEIFMRRINFYGTTRLSGSTTTITVHSTFNNFPENTHPDGNRTGALFATIAHEIKHAIQYRTNRWDGQAGSFDWIEMDATLMEEVVFPDVNDYYNYIMNYNSQANDWNKSSIDCNIPSNRNRPYCRSIFGNPESPTPGAYWHVTWMLYFYENYGGEFWVDVWQQFKEEREKPFIDAMKNVLERKGLTFEQEHTMNHMWHMVSGPVYSPVDFGFRDRVNYPNAFFGNQLFAAPDSLTNLFLDPMAATYIDMQPSNTTPGQPMFTVQGDSPGMGLGVVAYFRNGTTDAQISVNPNGTTTTLQTVWDWADITDIKIAVVNTNRNNDVRYSITATSVVPDVDTIAQNYPNPFNPTTRIEFSLSETKDVKVEVYDRIGRKVTTLVDDRLSGGFHSVTFDGSGLASGLYFYRIITDQTQLTRKMILVK